MTRNQPLVGGYRDRTITTNQSPGGGAMLLEMLNILENLDLRGMEHNSPVYIQLVCEVMKKATTDKDRCIGDPKLFVVPPEQLLSKDIARELAAQIHAGQRFSAERVSPGAPRHHPPQRGRCRWQCRVHAPLAGHALGHHHAGPGFPVQRLHGRVRPAPGPRAETRILRCRTQQAPTFRKNYL